METTSTPLEGRTDAIHAFAGRALAVLDGLVDAAAWAMTPAEQAEALVELTQVAARLTELRWRVLAVAQRDDLGAKDGSTSAAAWLARHTRETRSRTNGELRAAVLLDDPRYSVTREAFARGDLTESQLWVVLRAIEDLPASEVTEEDRVTAQQHLVMLAAEHDAKQLRVLARRLFEVLAPDTADEREAEALEREERRAAEACRFAMRDNGDGTSSGWFKLPTLQAAMLGKAVQAFAAPRRLDPGSWLDAEGRKVPYPVQLGRAFADLIEHLPVDGLPQAGGTAASIVVTMDLGMLVRGLGAAALDTGDLISAQQARRMACNAGLIPAVLGSDSVPLDLGRTARLHSRAQRVAMGVRDGGCTAQGCDRPPAWCEAHHPTPWSQGGSTSLDNGRLLCPHHHRLAHDTAYDMQALPDGKARFHRRT